MRAAAITLDTTPPLVTWGREVYTVNGIEVPFSLDEPAAVSASARTSAGTQLPTVLRAGVIAVTLDPTITPAVVVELRVRDDLLNEATREHAMTVAVKVIMPEISLFPPIHPVVSLSPPIVAEEHLHPMDTP